MQNLGTGKKTSITECVATCVSCVAYIPAVPSLVATVTISGGVSVIPVPGRSRVTVIVKADPSITDVDVADRATVPSTMQSITLQHFQICELSNWYTIVHRARLEIGYSTDGLVCNRSICRIYLLETQSSIFTIIVHNIDGSTCRRSHVCTSKV